MIKRILICVLVLFMTGINVIDAQVVNNDAIEVGIIEHLEDTIPLDLTFLNEQDDTIRLGDLIDKPTVFSFVYFDCPGLCSPLLHGISEVIEKSNMELGKDYQVITISFNTSDTPEKARQKKINFSQNISKDKSEHWFYLTGNAENIAAITNSIGFKYKKTGLDFAHPSAIMMISPNGKITRYLFGLTYLPFDLQMAVVEAQQEMSRPTINRILKYCFSYDPQGQRYAFEITKVVASIIIFFAVVLFLVLIFKKKSK